ncbi:hypothetical protein HAX54_000922 [Datura stramonium]|uniref:Uncharacterized protein n=1 Tax=Datura stramonium TaxID=4076 RepID=A0ABS8T2S8_DATST|nr:hypothetical protein [Datura stramonium]
MLQHLNLTWNSFIGTIPSNLSYCKELRSLALEFNSLVGKIPDQLSSLSKMNYLGLASNNLTGGIPSWIGNFSSLRGLSLAINNLQGPIPQDIGRLSNLQIFQIYGNQLNGPIPVSLSNASKLGVIELSQNKLTGSVPTSLGLLQGLYRINFEINSLGRNRSGDLRFLDFLVNCTSLQVLSFEDNFLGGEVPKAIGNLSTRLEIFGLGYNMIVGSFPTGLENLVNLTSLSLDNNNFRGSIPDSLACYIVIRNSRKRDLSVRFSRERQSEPTLSDDPILAAKITYQDIFKSTDGFSEDNLTSIALKGSIGYIPPEYGSGANVSTLGDVYSFGIMLLELFTGRRPTDEIFKDGLNIQQYVKTTLPGHVKEIADPSLLLAYEEHNRNEDNASDLEEKAILQDDESISKLNESAVIEECLVSILKIGLLCSSSLPRDRMPISIALDRIHSIKKLFLQSKRRKNSIDRSYGTIS